MRCVVAARLLEKLLPSPYVHRVGRRVVGDTQRRSFGEVSAHTDYALIDDFCVTLRLRSSELALQMQLGLKFGVLLERGCCRVPVLTAVLRRLAQLRVVEESLGGGDAQVGGRPECCVVRKAQP